MPSASVQITTPIVAPGRYFTFKYHKLPSDPWTTLLIYDNNVHVISGLSAGNYEATVSYYDGADDCSLKWYLFTVRSGCNCDTGIGIDCSRRNGVVTLEINSTAGATPPTLYELTVIDTNSVIVSVVNAITLNGTRWSFPDNGATGFSLHIESYCGGNMDKKNDCGTYDILCLDAPSFPIVVTSSKLRRDGTAKYIQIDFTQSTPMTAMFNVTYQQTDIVHSGGVDFGNYFINSVTSPLMIPIAPNMNVDDVDNLNYDWMFHDVNGNSFSGTVTG